jgi:uncharacterized protein
MKFHADQIQSPNVVQSHDEHGVRVGGQLLNRSAIIPWQGTITAWPVDVFETLKAEHFDAIACFEPDIVILGSGPRLRFVHPALLQPLMTKRIGIETMDNAAACRTYNVLLSEGRLVLLALLLPPTFTAASSPA